MKITNPITLDVARSNSYICLLAKQFDSNSRYLEITLADNGQPLTIPADASAVLRATRADGTGAVVSGTVANGKATVEIDDYILEVNGAVTLSLEISKDGETLTTPSCNLTVQKADASGWIRVYVADSSKAAGNYYITIGGVSYSFTTSQAIPAGGSVYFSSNNATAETRDATGTVIETGLVLTQGVTGTELVSDVPAISFLAALLASKADIDGSYENLTAGNAEQLVSSVGVNDKVPYNFRTTGGSADVGNRKTEKIIGGTIAWNQLNNVLGIGGDTSDLTYTFNNNGEVTITGTSNKADWKNIKIYSVPNAHKLLHIASPQLPQGFSLGASYAESRRSYLFDGSGDAKYLRFAFQNGVTMNYNGHINTFDLTAMFGSEIADYLYTLETATPGAGVAKFRQLFPKPYYAYNAGELMSVKTSKAVMTGFNQWDEEWVNGLYVDGVLNPAFSNYVSSKNMIPVIPNTTYYFYIGSIASSARDRFFYDADGNYIGSQTGQYTDVAFVTPINAHYMQFSLGGAYGATYKNDICINFSWDGERDGEFESFKTYEYPLDPDLELRGIWKLDANNNIYCDGDEYESDGKVTRRYEYRAHESGDESLTDAITDGTHTVVKIATPIEESADPYTNPMIVDDFGTEEFVDSRDVAVPVGHDTFYQANLRAKLEMAPNSPSGDGDYIVRQTSGVNEYIPISSNSAVSGLLTRVPEAPAANGTYVLKATVSGGVKTYSWVAE